MQTKSSVKYVRMSPLKVRRVLDQIRGKKALESMTMLNFLPHASARVLEKILKSAIANAENNHQVPAAKLWVREAFVDQGPTLKRFQPHAQGRAFPIKKRTSHITIVVSDTMGVRGTESAAPAVEAEAKPAKATKAAKPAEGGETVEKKPARRAAKKTEDKE
jgi:large subunit ribosomal protein L22